MFKSQYKFKTQLVRETHLMRFCNKNKIQHFHAKKIMKYDIS